MHGHDHTVTVPVQVSFEQDGLRFSGQFTIRQTDFGMEPESVALGSVHVKDEVQIRFRLSTEDARFQAGTALLNRDRSDRARLPGHFDRQWNIGARADSIR